jgi:cytochrome c peroxidase
MTTSRSRKAERRRSARRLLPLALALAVGAAGVGDAAAPAAETVSVPSAMKQRFRRPRDIPFPPDDPFSAAKAALGRQLFFEPALSASGELRCATCHDPAHGWGSPPVRPAGANGTPPERKPPSLLDLAWAEQLMWDGSEADLDSQIVEPLTNPRIMGNAMPTVIARLRARADYAAAFAAAFPGRAITAETIGQALGTFERTLVSPRSRFDDWIDGDDGAIPPAAQRGFLVFNSMTTRCVDCHSGWRFTDGTFRDTAMPDQDLGRGALRPDIGYLQHAFKTPGLREIASRGPYMHDGSLADLDQVTQHYAVPPVKRASLPDYIRGFELPPSDRDDLKAFLETLSAPAEAR